MAKDFNYPQFRPLDVVCTSSTTVFGRLIRLYTARLKGKNGLLEATRQKIANHCAIVVMMDGKYWLAEMLAEGLQINSMRNYLNNSGERIVAVKRNNRFDNDVARITANEALVAMCQATKGYDYSMVLEYLTIGKNEAGKYYCSELCEVIANMYATTWDNWQLMKKKMISPVEIQFGNMVYCSDVNDIYI